MFAGVSKSGSPAERLMMSRPASFSRRACAVIATVGDGLMRASAAERKAMAAPGLHWAEGVIGSAPARTRPPERRRTTERERHDRERAEVRLRRLRMRSSRRRGTREMDLILGALRRRAASSR